MKSHRLSNCIDACVRSADVSRRADHHPQLTLWHLLEGLAFTLFCFATAWILSAMAAG